MTCITQHYRDPVIKKTLYGCSSCQSYLAGIVTGSGSAAVQQILGDLSQFGQF